MKNGAKLIDFLLENKTIETLEIYNLKNPDFSECCLHIFYKTNLKHVYINGTDSAMENTYNHLKTHGYLTWKTFKMGVSWKVISVSVSSYCHCEFDSYCDCSDEIGTQRLIFFFNFHASLKLCSNLYKNKLLHEYIIEYRGCIEIKCMPQ